MSNELPNPRTRKEYFMAKASGMVPGVDMPIRYEVAPVMEHKSYEYEATLVDQHYQSGYYYRVEITDFVFPSLLEWGDEGLLVTINGKAAEYDDYNGAYINEDGYGLVMDISGDAFYAYNESETELTGDALKVTIETSWDEESEGIVLQPHTVEEVFWAGFGGSQIETSLPTFPKPKTRRDKYIEMILANNNIYPWGEPEDDG